METDDGQEEDDWMPYNRLPSLALAQILVLKLCRRRCLEYAQSESAMDVATPVLKMLFTILDRGGSLKENSLEWYSKDLLIHTTY